MGRFRNAVARANSKVSVQLAASMLAMAMIVSGGLGLVRDFLLNGAYLHTYPVGIDAFRIAFMIPDFMYSILVSGALSVTFIPVFSQRLVTGNRKSAWELSTSLVNFMALTTLIASILIIIFADQLVRYVVGPGLDESGRGLAVSMMRVIAVNPFLFAVATVIASMQQAIGRFTFYAIAMTLYNVGTIVGILFFTNGITIFGWHVFEGGIMGVALGVVLGSIVNLLVSSLGLIGLGFDYQFKIYRKNKGFIKVLRLLPARSLDQGIDYINNIVEINLASRLSHGSVAIFQQVASLHMMPVNFIGNAISTAVFPRMTAHLGEGRPDLFKKDLQSVLRVIIWLVLPVTIITYLARGYLVALVSPGGMPQMADLLGILAVAILFRSIYHIAARSFYAQQDTRTPLYISLFVIALNITLAIWFTLGLELGVYGLAWAESIVAIVEIIILFTIMSRRIPGLFDNVFVHAIARMASATGFMAVITYMAVRTLPFMAESWIVTFMRFVCITAISFSAYVVLCWMFRLEEINPVLGRAKKILFGQV